MKKTQIFAHRGSSKAAPENTMAAFEKALEDQADGIELDVQLTKDHHVVVIHDELVDRTTNGMGPVHHFSLSEIQKLDSGTWFSPSFSGQRIPTLSEVLEWIKDTDLVLNIELKNKKVAYPGLEQKVVELVEYFGMEKRVILSSFNHQSLKYLHQLRPNWRIGVLFDSYVEEPWNYAKQLGAEAIHPPFQAVYEEAVRICHAHGIRLRPFTVDDPVVMERFIQLGIDAIITNVPDQLKRIRDGKDELKGQKE